MQRGDISNIEAPLIALDFDSLVVPPTQPYQVKFLKRFAWFEKEVFPLPVWARSRLTWYFLSHWYTVSPTALQASYWLVARGFNLIVLIRLTEILKIGTAMENLLEDFPTKRFHFVQGSDAQQQASQIITSCRALGIQRFFTMDELIARHLPGKLVKFVKEWLADDLLR